MSYDYSNTVHASTDYNLSGGGKVHLEARSQTSHAHSSGSYRPAKSEPICSSIMRVAGIGLGLLAAFFATKAVVTSSIVLVAALTVPVIPLPIVIIALANIGFNLAFGGLSIYVVKKIGEGLF